MKTADIIIEEMRSRYDEKDASHLARFFKTGKGEYGEGDKFLGLKVPFTRTIVKKYKKDISLEDIETLINSEWHEIRLAGFLLLIELYKQNIIAKDETQAKKLVDFYLNNLDKGNNWDLVDLVAPYILGDWVVRKPDFEKILINLSGLQDKLWHQRVSIVSTFTLIKTGKFDLTFKIAEKFLSNKHDLIHKATGWMLREIGKRGGKDQLTDFLTKYRLIMPRTMLRYAIEKFTPEEKKHFMAK